jgi:hypothetical protein
MQEASNIKAAFPFLTIDVKLLPKMQDAHKQNKNKTHKPRA